MTDERNPQDRPEEEMEHDEYHSSLEVDDSSGWRIFIIPGLLVLFVVGALLFIFLSPDDGPDPRIANRLTNPERTIPVEPVTIPPEEEQAADPAADPQLTPAVGNEATPEG